MILSLPIDILLEFLQVTDLSEDLWTKTVSKFSSPEEERLKVAFVVLSIVLPCLQNQMLTLYQYMPREVVY